MEIHNPLISAEILSPNKKPQDREDSKIAYCIDGSSDFNKTNTFSSYEEDSIGSIHFNGEILT